MRTERFETVVIGGGQAGLSAGAHLARTGRSFVIVDAHDRIGDNWRERYDSLRLFTPTHWAALPFDRYPSKGGSHAPTRDEFAAYLEGYVERFELPVRTGVWVDHLGRDGDTYVIETGDVRYECANVIVATGAHREGRVPALSGRLDPSIMQLHSTGYRNPSQIPDGPVLVVGAGNSGADISLELARTHEVWLSGPERGHIPADIDSWIGREIGSRIFIQFGRHVLTERTPLGRRVKRKGLGQGDPLVRVKPKQLLAAGIHRVGKTVEVRNGLPVVEEGTALDVATVIWCTGFRHDLSWIDLPIFQEDGRPRHERGVVTEERGLYFVGLPFQFSAASDVLPGVGRDAAYVVKRLDRRSAGMPAATVAA